MTKQKINTHIAGFCYLIIVLNGLFSLMYVPKQLFDWRHADTMFHNISSQIQLFRWSVFSGIICYLAYAILPLILYDLLKDINKRVAVIMVLMVYISLPIVFFNLAHKLDIITIISDPALGKLFSTDEAIREVFKLIHQYENGITIASIFWGLWLLPFGYLVYKSGFLPKVLGMLLMAGCFGYCINIFGNLLIKDYQEWGISGYVSLPASLGEIGICLWMLIFGSRENI